MKKTRFLGTLTLVLACLALAFLTEFPQFLKYKKGDIKDFETVEAGELKKGDLVQGTIDLTEGCIAEMETSNKTMGITTSKHTSSQYYAVYMYNDQCILYETGDKSQWTTLDRMGDEYVDYLTSYDEVFSDTGSNDFSDVTLPTTTMEFTGKVVEMSSDLEAISASGTMTMLHMHRKPKAWSFSIPISAALLRSFTPASAQPCSRS